MLVVAIDDIRGAELGGAMKSVLAIAAADAMGLGLNVSMCPADRYGVELPISSNVRDVLHGDITPAAALRRLLARGQKAENG